MSTGQTDGTRGDTGLSAMASLFVALISAIATFVGTFDRFGIAGGLFIIAVLLIAIPALNNLPRLVPSRFRTLLQSVATALRLSSVGTKVLLALGCFAAFAGLILVFIDITSVRFFRDEFTRSHDHINVAHIDYADNHFRSAESRDLDSQDTREREGFDQWVRWMISGADRDLDIEQDGKVVGKEQERLLYVEGSAFDRNYTHVDAFVTVSSRLDVIAAIAFLKSDAPPNTSTRWYRPTLRQMHVTRTSDKNSVQFTLKNPNYGERPVLFVLVKPTEASELPTKDELLATHEIGVRP